ncbi:MAG: ABC transporter substrate-binding protein [Alphaproteobacteria bacterium]|nr:ABC transporter substrate-binding protein [Alphaproteobacteria bacterium]
MPSRLLLRAALAATLIVAGCTRPEEGPIAVSAIGGPPRLLNPSREPLDAPSAYLLQTTAQGLVRFDADGDITQGLAQSWIISDDGLRYTFRLSRAKWPDGTPITADQVVARLKAVAAPGSPNPLKPAMGAVEEVVGMTDEVLEIGLKAPRPNFLQLLAQPELAILRGGAGGGPFLIARQTGNAVRLTPPKADEESDRRPPPDIVLRGEAAGLAIARFESRQAALVLGGTAADLPLARAARLPGGASLAFDPVDGLFGLAFTPAADGPLAGAEVRQALSMAIDRGAVVAALGVPNLQARETLLPAGVEGIAAPAMPAWAAEPMPARRSVAQRSLAAQLKGTRLHLRVALPDGPGYRVFFAILRRDWAAIGVTAERVGPAVPADLRLIDEVAPAGLASWYLRHFACGGGLVCDAAADQALDAARLAATQDARRASLAEADRILAGDAPFIAIAAPVRWSLVGPRLTGFRPNPFGRHPAGELVRAAQ